MYHVNYRGLIGRVFSTGMDDLYKKVKIKGGTYDWNTWQTASELLIEDYTNGRIGGPIIIGGHSLGAVAAVRTAKLLHDNNIPVRMLYLFDYVWTLSNFFRSLAGKGDTTVGITDHAYHFKSRDGRVRDIKGAVPLPMYHLSHIELDDDRNVHEKVMELIKTHV